MTNHNTQYMRSVNDYSLSAHEIYSTETGSRFPIYTGVSTFRNIGADVFKDSILTVIKQFTDAEYHISKTYEISYDDGSSQDNENSYTIYDQRFYVMNKYEDGVTANSVVIEIYRRGGEVIVLTLSDSPIKHLVDAAGEIFRASYKPKPKEKVFYTIAQSQRGFELDELNIQTEYDDQHVEWHYNDDFVEVHKTIIDAIESNKKGLILLHGIPGSGKTSYIEQLISKGSNRKLVYIPPHLASSIASPSFITFVREELSGCVLVIEDAEEILKDREGYADSTAVSNLLNISDGILGKALNILIIATFNMDKQFIDRALLRKGRLLAEYRFDELSEEKALKLVKKLYGDDAELNLEKGAERSLANIFNMEVKQHRAKEAPKVAFGFVPGK